MSVSQIGASGKDQNGSKVNVRLYVYVQVLVVYGAFQAALVVKNLLANAGDIRDMGQSLPGSGRSPGEENGSSLQYSFQENSMVRGAWCTTLDGVTKCRTWLSD